MHGQLEPVNPGDRNLWTAHARGRQESGEGCGALGAAARGKEQQ